jgi:hypothetical protein
MLARKQAKKAKKQRARKAQARQEREARRAQAILRPQPPPPPPARDAGVGRQQQQRPPPPRQQHRLVVKRKKNRSRAAAAAAAAAALPIRIAQPITQPIAQPISPSPPGHAPTDFAPLGFDEDLTPFNPSLPLSASSLSPPTSPTAVTTAPNLQAFPEVVLLLACPFPPDDAQRLRVSTADGIARRLQSESKTCAIITPRDVLLAGDDGEEDDEDTVISHMVRGQANLLSHLLMAIRKRALLGFSRGQGMRVLLCGFNTFGLRQVQGLQRVLQGTPPETPLRLGVLFLAASDQRLAKKLALALVDHPPFAGDASAAEIEANRRIVSFHAQYDPVLGFFGGVGASSHVMAVPRMQNEQAACAEILKRWFGGRASLADAQANLKALRERHRLSRVKTRATMGTQTDGPAMTMLHRETDRRAKVLRVSRLGNGHLPMPVSALLEASSSSKFSCVWQRNKLDLSPRRSYQVDGNNTGSSPNAPPATTAADNAVTSMNDAAMHQLFGWFALLGLSSEVGHPDDWDRNFSNGFLVARILCAADPKLSASVQPDKNMRTAFSSAAKTHNWRWIDGVLSRVQGVTDSVKQSLSQARPGSALRMLSKLYRHLNAGALLGTKVPGAVGQAHVPSHVASTSQSLWEREQRRMLLRTGRLEEQADS